MIIAVIAVYLAKNIIRTRAGRAFVAIRDNDLAAEVMGVNLWSYKLQAFFIGCVFAGVAGALSVQYLRFANVDQFPFMDSVWFLGMLIVGGQGSVTGVIFGVVALKLVGPVRDSDRPGAGNYVSFPAHCRGRFESDPKRSDSHTLPDLRTPWHGAFLGAHKKLVSFMAVFKLKLRNKSNIYKRR